MARCGTIRDHRTNRDAGATADHAAMHPRRSLGLAVGAAVLAATVGFGPTASATPNITRYPYRTPCPLPFPSTNVWNKPVDTPAGRGRLGDADRDDRARPRPAPGLRVVRGLRHPVQRRDRVDTPRSTVTFDYDERVRPRSGYPIPAAPADRGPARTATS